MGKPALRVVRLLDPREPTTFPVVKHIPIPKRGNGGIYEKTMRSLDVGDSFLCASAGNVYQLAKSLGLEVTVRRAGSCWRVWRTA
jgi:hypothetical protein